MDREPTSTTAAPAPPDPSRGVPDLFGPAFDAVLLDLDGTLRHVGSTEPLPGALDLVAALNAAGRPFAVLSNSTLSPSRVCHALAEIGIELDPSRVHTAAGAACEHVAERFAAADLGRGPRVFDLMGDAVAELLGDAGRAEVVAVGDPGPCDAVIVGTPRSPSASPERQREAVRLARAGAAVVGSCADRVYPSPRGMEIGAGALTALVAYAAGATPTFTGKPEAVFFQTLCRRLGVEPSRCVLVGDNLESDVAGGRGVGMATVLVMGGVSTRDDVRRAGPDATPDAVVDSLGALLPTG